MNVSGPKGTLTQQFDPDMAISLENGQMIVTRPTDQREQGPAWPDPRAAQQHGDRRDEGFTRRLEIQGVGYRAEKRGNNLVFSRGQEPPG